MPPTISVNMSGQTGPTPKAPKSKPKVQNQPKGPSTKKQGKRKGKKNSRTGGPPKSINASVRAVCSMTNPFCDHAVGSRYADAAASKSLPFLSRAECTLNIGTGGYGLAVIDVRPDGVYVANSSTNSYDQVVGTFTKLTASALPTMDTSRVTVWGVKISTIQPVNTAAGMLKLYSLHESPGASDTFSLNSYFGDDISTAPASPGTVVYWVAKPANKVSARTFKNTPGIPDANLTELEGCGWQSLAVGHILGGSAAATTLIIDVYAHYEFTLQNTSSLYSYTRPAPPPNPKITSAVDKVLQTAPNTVWNKTPDTYDAMLEKAASYALSTAAKYAEDWIMAII